MRTPLAPLVIVSETTRGLEKDLPEPKLYSGRVGVNSAGEAQSPRGLLHHLRTCDTHTVGEAVLASFAVRTLDVWQRGTICDIQVDDTAGAERLDGSAL